MSIVPDKVNSNHRHHFGRQILAARAIYPLTRVELSKRAQLAHATVARAERGDLDVPEEALVKIRVAIEFLGFEFPDGATRTSIVHHEDLGQVFAGIRADVSMPGMVRRVYPQTKDVARLVHDLSAVGVRIVGATLLRDRCSADTTEPWQDVFTKLTHQGGEVGIRFFWQDKQPQVDEVSQTLETYGFSTRNIASILSNVLEPLSETPGLDGVAARLDRFEQ